MGAPTDPRRPTDAPGAPDGAAGAAVYSRAVLSIYDLYVLGFSNRWAWRCPSRHILDFYNAHVSAHHLDVGVGTGYFLDRCRFPAAQPRIALADLNPHSLAATARRLARYRPRTHRADVLQPLEITPAGFDSIGLNYLLHCLPGDLRRKEAVFAHLKPLLNPAGGVVFGSTILGDARHNGLGRLLMGVYNRKGIFGNADDRLEDLQAALGRHFPRFQVELRGCVALFAGHC